eukprot:TRINITY_DN773228_c0_g1_i1.p1 TRINITY_DN773228_c0_g1~~TRINITY_DN773228_c0_g1_i1.p1  ORF type:complete len:349 (-),score=93.21 TRINITY_DN773228_c0_g1_i1:215-1261(-)
MGIWEVKFNLWFGKTKQVLLKISRQMGGELVLVTNERALKGIKPRDWSKAVCVLKDFISSREGFDGERMFGVTAHGETCSLSVGLGEGFLREKTGNIRFSTLSRANVAYQTSMGAFEIPKKLNFSEPNGGIAGFGTSGRNRRKHVKDETCLLDVLIGLCFMFPKVFALNICDGFSGYDDDTPAIVISAVDDPIFFKDFDRWIRRELVKHYSPAALIHKDLFNLVTQAGFEGDYEGNSAINHSIMFKDSSVLEAVHIDAIARTSGLPKGCADGIPLGGINIPAKMHNVFQPLVDLGDKLLPMSKVSEEDKAMYKVVNEINPKKYVEMKEAKLKKVRKGKKQRKPRGHCV